MSEYTPTTEDVADAYRQERVWVSSNIPLNAQGAQREFDRWLAARDAEVFREGALWALRAEGHSESDAERAFENIREAEGLDYP